VTATPFLRWVGGKTQLLPELNAHIAKHVSIGKETRYFEPFVGAGALFFNLRGGMLRSGKVFLGDANTRLIRTYRALRDDPEPVIRKVRVYAKAYGVGKREHYFKVRDQQSAVLKKGDTDVAAWLIFMMAAGFNGAYRENRSGLYNVPSGKFGRAGPRILNEDNLRAVSRALQRVTLSDCDFEVSIKKACVGDFVYFDSPYWPKSKSADFDAYTKDPFGPIGQRRLRDVALKLKRQGVQVLLSNADVQPVRELYKRGFKFREVSARRSINSNTKKRGPVGELLIW
jgi:DNA adenine methylase